MALSSAEAYMKFLKGSLKKGQTASLVQKPYFVALSGRASPTSFQSSHHTARAHFYSGNFM
jgi:hypothetical protein